MSKIENNRDDDWIWDFDMDKTINAYHTFENQKSGLDESLEEQEAFVTPPEQLKETKVRRYFFHNDKRQAKVKEEAFVPPPKQ